MNVSSPRHYFALFLHGHLPWVLPYGRWPHGAEWLCEATIETYLPLIGAARRLRERGLSGNLTLGVSPVLAEQLASPRFADLFREYLEDRMVTAGEEAERFANEKRSEMAALARRWRTFYGETRRLFFESLGGDLLGALRDLEASGTIEIATCGATHAYLPLLARDESIALQLELARRVHERHFGQAPRGIWLPEAAYRPGGKWKSATDPQDVREREGLETFLARAGMRWFLVDSSLLTGGRCVGAYPGHFRDRMGKAVGPPDEVPASAGPSRPRDTSRSYWVAGGVESSPVVRFFVRDPDTALQVWSGEHGYPGDPAYLEFHKRSDGGGHHYWRVTGPGADLGDKEIYDPGVASRRVEAHADHFQWLVESELDGKPDGAILAAPFDAELFGHWWFEGISWLEKVLERFQAGEHVHPTSFSRHAGDFPPDEIVRLPEGSWGEGGRHWVWLNPEVEWMWKLVHPAENETWDLWRRAEAEARRVATAAGRQLVLLCASDWPFLVTTGTAADYATQRIRRHAEDIARLLAMCARALEGEPLEDTERQFLDEIDARDDLFPEMADAMRAAALATDESSA